MKRYFYTDPIAAIWMAKHFGMKFTVVEFTGKSSGGKGDYTVRKEYTLYPSPFCNKDGLATCKTDRGGELIASTSLFRFRNEFFIHTDSLQLLEPRDGDAIYGSCGGELVLVDSASNFATDIKSEQAKNAIAAGWRIIQRNGIPFMWPEHE